VCYEANGDTPEAFPLVRDSYSFYSSVTNVPVFSRIYHFRIEDNMNKEQLEFFYNEIMGMFGWDDEDTASGVDPLLWAKKEYEIRNVKLAQLRAHEETLSAIADKEKAFSFTLRQENCQLRAELDEQTKAVEEAREAILLHNVTEHRHHALEAWLTAHPEGKEASQPAQDDGYLFSRQECSYTYCPTPNQCTGKCQHPKEQE